MVIDDQHGGRGRHSVSLTAPAARGIGASSEPRLRPAGSGPFTVRLSQGAQCRVAPVANDDWRVTITLHEAASAGQAAQRMHEHEVEDDVRRQLGHRIVVSENDAQIFLYAGSEDAAREADWLVRGVLAQHGLQADFALDRWHPIEEQWEDASVGMPQTAGQRQSEHLRLEEEESRESVASGHAQWEVRVELPSHHEATELAERLRGESRAVIRRWKFLVIGANNEHEADSLAKAIRQDAPQDASVRTEMAGALVPFILF
jgi:hypothetical protein